MAHAVDAHDTDFVGDFIDHALVTHPNAPVVFPAREFPATMGPRVRPERRNRSYDSFMHGDRETTEIFLRRTLKQDPIHGQ
ncbi:MAG: hypothetical protein ABIQ12_03125 [Opitutaceae bacterium]